MALGLALQLALQVIPPIVLFPLIMFQAIGGSEADFLWAAFSMLLVNGLTAILQTLRWGPAGSGLIAVTYPSITAMPFCILALERGGPAVLSALLFAFALAQILVSFRLSWVRQIVTPSVSGTILILLIITIVPVIFGSLGDIPEGAPPAAGAVCIAVTLVATLGLLLKGSERWQVWAPLLGIGAGSVAAGLFGIYDLEPFHSAPVVGLPLAGWPGISFAFDRVHWLAFLGLLPVFLFLAVVSVLTSSSVGVSTQRVSWRKSRAMDYRVVQGGVIGVAFGNLLASLAGNLPIIAIPRGITFILQTGCASRHVGTWMGLLLVGAAFIPKSWALLMGIPAPVNSIFIAVMMGPLLVEGIKMVAHDPPDFRKGLVIGTAIVAGLGFQSGLINLPMGDLWSSLFSTAVTAGGSALVILTLISELKRRHRDRLSTGAHVDSLPDIHRFMAEVAERRNWSSEMTQRAQTVAEEILVVVAPDRSETLSGDIGSLRISVTEEASGAILECVTAPGDIGNLEDSIALLTAEAPSMQEPGLASAPMEMSRDISLRLLSGLSSSVTHQQYHETEIITARIPRV